MNNTEPGVCSFECEDISPRIVGTIFETNYEIGSLHDNTTRRIFNPKGLKPVGDQNVSPKTDQEFALQGQLKRISYSGELRPTQEGNISPKIDTLVTVSQQTLDNSEQSPVLVDISDTLEKTELSNRLGELELYSEEFRGSPYVAQNTQDPLSTQSLRSQK